VLACLALLSQCKQGVDVLRCDDSMLCVARVWDVLSACCGCIVRGDGGSGAAAVSQHLVRVKGTAVLVACLANVLGMLANIALEQVLAPPPPPPLILSQLNAQISRAQFAAYLLHICSAFAAHLQRICRTFPRVSPRAAACASPASSPPNPFSTASRWNNRCGRKQRLMLHRLQYARMCALIL